jgi:predicted metalloprotease with PDZ domain
LVATPYTVSDLRAVLAEVSGDKMFAETFFSDYVQGSHLVNYATLLEPAGLVLRKRNAGAAFLMAPPFIYQGGGARVSGAVAFESALYKAGVDRDDLITALDGVALTTQGAFNEVLKKRTPGDQVPLRFVRRGGETVTTTLTLEEDPRLEIVPVEQLPGGVLKPEQKRFRESWLSSRVQASGAKAQGR